MPTMAEIARGTAPLPESAFGPTAALTPEPPPLAAPPPPVDPFAGLEKVDIPDDPFAGLEKVDIPDPFAGLEKADDLDFRSVEELDADRDTFHPKDYFAANPDVAKDPAKLAKLLEVYRRRDKEGLVAGQVTKEAVKAAVPTVGKILGGARDLTAGALDIGLQPAANLLGSIVTGDIFDPQMRKQLFRETVKVQKKGIAQSAAAAELSATGLADLARTGARKVAPLFSSAALDSGVVESPEAADIATGAPAAEKTDQELLRQLSADVEFGNQLSEVMQGRGEAAKAIGLDAETLAKEGITLDPEVIERLSLVDPLSIVAGGGVFKGVTAAGKTVFTAGTRAAAAGVIEKLSQAAAKSITAPVRQAGKAMELTGATVQNLGVRSPLVRAAMQEPLVRVAMAGSALASGNPLAIGAVAAREAAPYIAATGRGIQTAAAALGNSTTFQKALAGTAAGVATAAPIAALSDDDRTAGAIFGAGALLGGAIGGPGKTLVEATKGLNRIVSNRTLAPKDIVFPAAESRPYGINENLDIAHADAIRSLPTADQNKINAFRETTRDLGGEVYVLSPEVFDQTLLEHAERVKGAPLTAEDIASARELSRTQGYFDNSFDNRRAIFLNSAAEPITHETGHLFHALLSPERNADLVQAARTAYTPEQIAQFKAQYEADLGRPVSEDYILNELVAENFSQLFRNTPVAELNTPRSLLQKIGRTITDFAEQKNLDLTGGEKTPLGLPSSLRFNDVVRDAAREILAPRPPEVVPRTGPMDLGDAARELAPLVEVRPTAPRREVPVVVEEAAAGRQRQTGEPPVTDATEARTIAQEAPETVLPGAARSQREILGTVAEAIANKQGVRYNYRSAPDAPGASAEQTRSTRRAEIEAARNMPEDVRRMVETTGLPYKIDRTSNGVIQVFDWTPDMLAANALRWAKSLSELSAKDPNNAALKKVKYDLDVQAGEWTEQGWRDIFKDAETFSANQLSGFAGSGIRLNVPEVVRSSGAAAPRETGTPVALDQTRADFQNLLYGLRVPETPRVVGKGLPKNIVAQRVSEATLPGRVVEPSLVEPKKTARARFKSGEEIREVNPLRAELEKALQAAEIPLPEGIEVVRRLNLEHIADVVAEPNLPRTAGGNVLTLTAGFQPERAWRISGDLRGAKKEITVTAADMAAARKLAESQGMRVAKIETADKMASALFQPEPVELAKMVENFSPSDFRTWASSVQGGLTQAAIDMGLAAPSREFVNSLKQRYDEIGPKAMAAIKAKRFDDGSAIASQAQFFRESYEAALGIDSVGAKLRKDNPNFQPPFSPLDTEKP